MSISLLYHALGSRDYGRTDHFASNGRGLAASSTRGSVARVRIWPWFAPFGHAAIVTWAARRGFTGRTPPRSVGTRVFFVVGLVPNSGS